MIHLETYARNTDQPVKELWFRVRERWEQENRVKADQAERLTERKGK